MSLLVIHCILLYLIASSRVGITLQVILFLFFFYFRVIFLASIWNRRYDALILSRLIGKTEVTRRQNVKKKKKTPTTHTHTIIAQ